MKNINKILLLLISVIVFVSCGNEDIIEVNPNFKLSIMRTGDNKAYVGTAFYVIPEGSGEYLTLYDGTEGHIYGEAGATGTFFDKNDSLAITYKKSGDYTITVVASSSVDFGKSFLRQTKSYPINVVDARNDITYFYIADATGKILYSADIINDSIIFKVPDVVSDMNFKPSFVLNSELSKVFVDGVEQTSAVSQNDFSQVVTYKVISSVNTEKNYYVKAKKFVASDEKNIIKFALAKFDAEAAYRNSNGEVADIDHVNSIINLSVNYGTLKTSSKIVLESPYASSVYINGTAYSTTKKYNLTNITEIKVIAQNNSAKTYSLNLTDQDPVSSFTFAGLVPAPIGKIDKVAKTITVDVLSGTDVSKLVAKWNGTVGKVTVGSTEQVNGVTSNNFSSPVTYSFYRGTTIGDQYTVIVNIK